jgi:precorrin-2 dehydrogenase / sirohydrochlorin ferrochelatase
MRYYPICLDLQNRPVLVVGGGVIAEGKALQLLEAQASIHLVSPTLTEILRQKVEQEIISYRAGEFTNSDLDGKVLVISATNIQAVNETVAQAANVRGMLCNVVDQPALCNFITPTIVTRGDLQIAISSSGKSPTVALRVKREISELIGEEYQTLLEITANLRAEFRQVTPDYNTRRDFLKSFVDSEALDLIRQGKIEEAKLLANKMLNNFVEDKVK